MSQSPALLPTLRRQFEHWLFDLPEELGGRALRWVVLPLRYLYALLRDIGRVRDVEQGPDGLIYLALDGGTRDADGPPTAILRLEP